MPFKCFRSSFRARQSAFEGKSENRDRRRFIPLLDSVRT
jgi:hypothetical protein